MITPSESRKLSQANKLSRQITVLICLFHLGIAFGAPNGVAKTFFELPEGYIVDRWSVEDGIPGTQVLSIAQSPDGYIWIGTYYGLARFDGQSFFVIDPTTHGLPTGSVFRILFGPKGKMWLGLGQQLASFNDGKFTTYANLLEKPTSSSIQLHHIAADGSVVYSEVNKSANQKRVMLLHPETTKRTELAAFDGFTPSSLVSAGSSRDGTTWIAYANRFGFLKGDQISIQHTFPVASNLSVCPHRSISDDIWLTVDGEVLRFDGQNMISNELSLPQTFPNDVLQVLSASHNSLWIRRKKGHYELYLKDETHRYSRDQSFQINGSRSIIDSEGTLWLVRGSRGGGLSRVRKRLFRPLASEGPLSSAARSVTETSANDLFIGSTTGLYKVSLEQILSREKLAPEKLRNGDIWTLDATDKEQVYGGAYAYSLNQIKPRLFEVKENSTSPPRAFENGLGQRVVSICQDQQNRIWIGSIDSGLSCLDGDQTLRFTDHLNVPERPLSLACDLKGVLWIGTGDAGIYRFQHGHFEHLSKQRNLAAKQIRAIHVGPTGIVWFGTGGHGIYRFQNDTFHQFTSKNGLPSNEISTVVEDQLGSLWFGSFNGIHRVSLDNFERVAKGESQHLFANSFSLEDGLSSIQCTAGHPASLRSQDGRLWFATSKGFNYVDPKTLPSNRTPPKINLIEIHLDGRAHDLSERSTERPFTIPAFTSRVEIHFTGINFTAPKEVRFRYRLGDEKVHWNEIGTQRSVVFQDLPPGIHSFQVSAANQSGVWNEEGATLILRVNGPIWKTTWFRSMTGILLIGAIVGIFQFRLRQQRQKQELKDRFTRDVLSAQESDRKRIARELHDSLEQNLLVMKNRAALTLQSQTDADKMAVALTAISEISSQSITEVRQIANDLRPYQIDRLGLTKAMQSLLNQIASSTNIIVEHEIESIPDTVSQELKIHLYRILQEALNNILKHAEASLISVSLVTNEGRLSLRIKDNGNGFDSKKTETNQREGLGLSGIRERVSILSGQCELKSNPGFGTEWSIRVHFSKA